MQKQFVQCETEGEARDQCPWACFVVEADGGYWCFEDQKDYDIYMHAK